MNIKFWQGNKASFQKLKDKGGLNSGCVYFVGDSEKSGGLSLSSSGIIYVAVSASKAVRFGSFADGDDLQKIVEENRDSILSLLESNEQHTEQIATIEAAVEQHTAKLVTIAEGAEENVQANWNETDEREDSFVLNKPRPMTTIEILNILT